LKATRPFEALSAQQKVVTVRIGSKLESETSVRAHPSTAGETFKKCLLMDYTELCSEKKGLFNNVSLSQMNVQRSKACI